MPNLFDDATTEHYSISGGGAMVSPPFSAIALFKIDDLAAGHSHVLFCLGRTITANHFLIMGVEDGSDKWGITVNDGGGNETAECDLVLSTNTWYLGGGVFTSATSRKAYIGQIGSTPVTAINTVSKTPTLNDTLICAIRSGGFVGSSLSGVCDYLLVWDVALSDSDFDALYSGIRPNLIKPTDIVGEYRMIGASDGRDYSGAGNGMVATSTPAAATAGPRTLWTPKWAASVPLIEVAAGGGFAHSQAVIIA